ncbi:HAD family hydrolase [Candidatus Uhrbacteria bacterium]|nr:HAD family hydrolase [Candidatus Uhrbacteria bacterium]
MKHIKVILFDVDGTLMDTTDFMENAVRLTLDHFKLPQPSTEELFTRMNNNANGMCLYAQEHLPDLTDQQYWAVDHAMQEKSVHLCSLYDGIVDLLATLRMHQYALAVVTNRTLKTVIPSLKNTGIHDYFSHVVSSDDTEDRWTLFKPHPRILEIALERLGVVSKNACIVGDTHSDIQAGKNAGITTIGATYGFVGRDISAYNPDYVIHSPEELLAILEIRETTKEAV